MKRGDVGGVDVSVRNVSPVCPPVLRLSSLESIVIDVVVDDRFNRPHFIKDVHISAYYRHLSSTLFLLFLSL